MLSLPSPFITSLISDRPLSSLSTDIQPESDSSDHSTLLRMLITFKVGTFTGTCSLFVPGRPDTQSISYYFATMRDLKHDWTQAKEKLSARLEGGTEVIKEFRRTVESGECHLEKDEMNHAYHFFILEEISQVYLRADLKRHFEEKREAARLRLESENISDASSFSSNEIDIYDIMDNVPEDEYDPLDEDED